MPDIETARLRLIPLSRAQLQDYLDAPDRVEAQLGVPVSRSIVTAPLRRAIGIKVERMSRLDEEQHLWLTYWLAVVRDEAFGAGLLGFKGAPGAAGEVEIGYGIDPAYGGQGYTTEAARALIAWAFQDPACRAVIAPGTRRENVASNRVLQKLGMHVYAQDEETLSWRIDREF